MAEQTTSGRGETSRGANFNRTKYNFSLLDPRGFDDFSFRNL